MNENPNPTGEQATTDNTTVGAQDAAATTPDNTTVGDAENGDGAEGNNGDAEQAGEQAEAIADAVPTAEDKYNAAHAQRTEPRPGDGSYTPNHDHIGTPAAGVDDATNEA